jgi:hypothetical protein
MIIDAKAYADALAKLRSKRKHDPHTCMDFLESLGYSVGPLGNEEILQITEDILTDMDQEQDVR